MRRPSPIPAAPPPVEPAPAPEPPREQKLPAWAGAAEARSAQDLQETSPIVPLRLGGDQEPAPARGRDDSDPATVEDGRDAVLGPRDVWRAAKARRRALRAEIRRFTQRSRRRRIVWICAIIAAVLIVGGSAGAAYSPLFAVERISVEGTKTLDPKAVEQALSSQMGRPLALVDSSAVKAALVAFPLIETYQLEAHPPHDLTVRIVERTPVGVLASAGGFTVVDAAGVALSTTPDRPDGYALLDVTGDAKGPAFAAAGTVMRSLPDAIRSQVDTVTAASADSVRLSLRSGVSVVWGSGENSAMKAYYLGKLMAATPDKTFFDVSSSGAVVVG